VDNIENQQKEYVRSEWPHFHAELIKLRFLDLTDFASQDLRRALQMIELSQALL
jgi:hypothetical protein